MDLKVKPATLCSLQEVFATFNYIRWRIWPNRYSLSSTGQPSCIAKLSYGKVIPLYV